MGVVDSVKDLRRLAVERLHSQPVVFHHVPKCGGTSVGRALRKRYILSQATIHPESTYKACAAFQGSDDQEALLLDVLDLREQLLLYLMYEETRCVSAHVRFSQKAYDIFGDTYKFITILREPTSRFISNFHWSNDRADDHGKISGTFLEFLRSDRAKRHGAMYVNYFSGLPKEADIRTPQAIDLAIENLKKFAVVGRLDDMKTFKDEVSENIGIGLNIGHENKRKREGKGLPKDIDADVQTEIEAICAPDLAVWRAVVEPG